MPICPNCHGLVFEDEICCPDCPTVLKPKLYDYARFDKPVTPIKADDRVQGLIDALEYASSRTHEDVTIFMETHKDLGQWEFRDELLKRIRDKAKNALSKYRGEVEE